MGSESQIRKLSDGELIFEVKATEELIYRIECFGTRDLLYLDLLYYEIERRGLEERVPESGLLGSEGRPWQH